ncbi:gliding motility-associated C-terminal domain-containing protein [Saccharicrinis sp. 156]|uniref:T9SS type B sorting domain-containing protein n=1 Tax=Saccharicrinis sp. 156 TaxID=3417574 RepID=UPI003D35796F
MKHIFFLFFLISSAVSAQLLETWSDSDFTTPPTWQGDMPKFTINTTEQKLKLSAEAVSSQAYLSTPCTAINNATWEFSVQMDFNPSSSNYAIIYLTSNQAGFSNNMEGYYVMVGNTQDEVSLYKQSSERITKIIDGTDKILDSSPSSVSVRVLRDDLGNWQLYTKQGSANYILEGEVFDNDLVSSSYFGIYCKYTSTRSDKFSFGPITVSGTGFIDTEKPRVISHQLIAGKQFVIQLNKNPNPASVSENDFEIVPNSLQPKSISVDNSMITLNFNDYLVDTDAGQLIVKDIEDESGNLMNDTALNYSFERIKVLTSKVTDEFQLQLAYNKTVDATVIDTNPISSALNFGNPTLVNDSALLFKSDNPMAVDQTYRISVSGILAESGDIMKDTIIDITYRKPGRYDIIFTEIMPDPTPNIGLYDSEYIEIHNRRDYPINLEGMWLTINGKKSVLPNHELPPDSYALIINQNELENWPNDLPLIGIKSLPALNNNSGTLVLYYANNLVSDVLQYPLMMEEGGFKTEGGWPLERIDNENQQPEFNWSYSTHLDGGTPGLDNSVINFNPDITAPYLKYISYINPSTFAFVFSETLKGLDNFTPSGIQIEGAAISDIAYDSIFLKSFQIYFSNELQLQQTFTVNFVSSLSDFADNNLSSNHSLRIGIPEALDSFDIVINEVLFDPAPDGIDFVELYNRSDKILNRSDIYLSSLTDLVADELEQVDDKNQLLFPSDYLVVTEDSFVLSQFHPSAISEFINQSHLPSLNDDEGNIAITKNTGEIFDYFEYTDDMHFALLRDKEGVSLERINPHATTNSPHNWHSASEQSGYSTPTLQNSQYAENPLRSNTKWLSIDKEEFSPNADGTSDNLHINYSLDKAGWTGTVAVYNRYGHVIKTIAHNELLGLKGFFTWDGTTDNLEKAPIGIYIVYGDIFSSTGKTKKEKITVVLTAGAKRE